MTPDADANLDIYALSTEVPTGLTPGDSQTEFEPGFGRVYIYYAFRSMNWGALWTRALYRDGELLIVEQSPWQLDRDGRAYYFFFYQEGGGFIPGEYEVHFFVGDELASRATFVVRGP